MLPDYRPACDSGSRSGIGLLRGLLLCALLVVVPAFVPVGAAAQDAQEIPEPSETVYEIQLSDGSLFFARIAVLEEEQVVLVTTGGARVEIDRLQIRSLRPVRGSVVNDRMWIEDPSNTRLFFAATGRSLSQGEGYVGTYVVVLPFGAIGIHDRVALSAGAPVLLGEWEPVYFGPKVQFLRHENIQAAVGAFALVFQEDTYGLGYVVGTIGTSDRAFTAGLGFFFSGTDVGYARTGMLGGEVRISRRIKLMSENYFFIGKESGHAYLSGGFRFIGSRFSTEVGTVTDVEFCCLPFINFSYSFGR